jgi:regulator of CtrA degradation
MSDFSASAQAPWRANVISDFARSELFDRTFQEGMDLVEETAAYLDGGGRQDSKLLSRSAALAYASESMRLTTRLMQIASWLLVQRAVAEGEITPDQARTEKNRVKIADMNIPTPSSAMDMLPLRLRELMDASQRMQARVMHLETMVIAENEASTAPAPVSNAVSSQLDRLKAAFAPSAA